MSGTCMNKKLFEAQECVRENIQKSYPGLETAGFVQVCVNHKWLLVLMIDGSLKFHQDHIHAFQ